jgi:hypothetical protein
MCADLSRRLLFSRSKLDLQVRKMHGVMPQLLVIDPVPHLPEPLHLLRHRFSMPARLPLYTLRTQLCVQTLSCALHDLSRCLHLSQLLNRVLL